MNLIDGMQNANKQAGARLNDLSDALPMQRGSSLPFENYLTMARARAQRDPEFAAEFEAALAEYSVKQQRG